MDIEIVDLTENNFNLHSFDEFEFRQDVTSCWRYGKQGYNLTPVSYTDDENSQRKKQHAKRILESIKSDCVAFGAVHNGMLVGFAVLDKKIVGKSARYMNLSELYVSRPFRGNGAGKLLFDYVCKQAQSGGAEKLYVSAHSAKESAHAYFSYGCVFAEEVNEELSQKEPFDLQLEFVL